MIVFSSCILCCQSVNCDKQPKHLSKEKGCSYHTKHRWAAQECWVWKHPWTAWITLQDPVHWMRRYPTQSWLPHLWGSKRSWGPRPWCHSSQTASVRPAKMPSWKLWRFAEAPCGLVWGEPGWGSDGCCSWGVGELWPLPGGGNQQCGLPCSYVCTPGQL